MAVRWLFSIHRYLGAVIGVLMCLWCLSGVVMMYVPYPALSGAARSAGLEPIAWQHCCKLPDYGRDAAVSNFTIEMMAGRPVMRLGLADYPGETELVDLTSGETIERVTSDEARSVALAYAKGNGLEPSQPRLSEVWRDQWTVSGGFDADRPLYRVDLGDPAGTEIYVSGSQGDVVQSTTASQRFWNYLGSIPHWIYFTELRKDAAAWTRVIIWTSLTGCFLTVTGIYIGIRQWNRVRRARRWSPYRGVMLWHHVPGIVFGVLTLTWVASGFLSVTPWGLLAGGGARAEREKLLGAPISESRAAGAVGALAQALHGSAAVSVSSARLKGVLYEVATRTDGSRVRFDVSGQPAPLTPADLGFITSALGAAGSAELLAHGDNYYFGYDGATVSLPVYRVVQSEGGAHNRYYFDPVSGALISKVDAGAKGYRWIQQGLHRFDFVAALRARPVWDIVMLALMIGVTAVCATGAYLSLRFLLGLSDTSPGRKRARQLLEARSPTSGSP